MSEPTRPLEGVRVIGLEQYMAGPYCTLLLADAGAEVIKVERPGSGDPRRQMPPFVERDGLRKAAGFMGYNRNKKSLALNLQDEEGREVLKRLVAESDVVVDNLRPGAMDRLGLGYDALGPLNPRLVYAVISGFGRMAGYRGPYSDRPAFDIVAEAMSGIMHLVGFEDRPPSWTIYGMADIYSGMVTAWGITQALFMRTRTGRGQLVDSAMYDNMLALNESMVTLHALAGQSPHRGRPRNAYPRGAYAAADGWVAINVPDDRIWRRLCELIERTDLVDDPRTRGGAERAANRELIDAVLNGWLGALSREAAVQRLNDTGVPAGPVNTAEDVFACPQVAARHMIMDVDDPELGVTRLARTVPHLSAAPEPPAHGAPALGAHTREVLQGVLAMSAAEVDALAGRAVIQVDDDSRR